MVLLISEHGTTFIVVLIIVLAFSLLYLLLGRPYHKIGYMALRLMAMRGRPHASHIIASTSMY